MFVRVESVLFIGLFATCLAATTGLLVTISPEHLHSSSDKPATFTCSADREVTACEFLVRYNDKDLVVVNPTQASSGSWDLTSSGDQPSLQTSQSGATTNAPERPAAEKRKSGPEASHATEDGVQEDVSNVNPPVPERKRVGVSQNSPLTASPWPWNGSQTGNSPSRLASRISANDQSDDQRPVWPSLKRANRKEPCSLSSRAAPDYAGNYSLTVLREQDATQAPAAEVRQKPARPYPSNETKNCRRQHKWKYGSQNRETKRRVQGRPELQQRIGDDGYQWEATSSKDVCTLRLPSVREGRHLIGCRMRLAEGGWEYATSSMDVSRFKSMGLTVTNPPVVNPGTYRDLILKTNIWMTSCHANGYNGTLSSSRKECRVTVSAASGLVWCTAVYGTAHREARPAFIRVRTVPTRLEYALPKTRFMEGEYFTATCAVGPLQSPAPNMSWYIGEELLRADADDDIADPEWVWPWEGRIFRQSLFLTVTAEDDNLPLICQVEHPVLAKPLTKSARLRVNQDIDDGTSGCGLLPDSEISTRIQGGTKPTNHVPWISAVYQRTRSGKFEHKCGGTLVTRRLIVSSAQCFWDATYSRIADPSQFRVALGSLRREWEPSDARAQSPGIVRIAVPRHFIGRNAYFAYDIAVLVLDSPVTLSEEVLPACIDRSGALQALQIGDSGTVSGWGVTETGRTSPTLRSIQLPYVDIDECNGAVSADLHRYITYDKFCAGYRNRSKSVCPGDSGGGLVFLDPVSERHYLRGIASVAFAPIGNDENCFADLYTGFTLVSEYTTWIFKQAPPPPVDF